MHASRAIFASYLRNAGEKAIQLTALASSLWHGIQAQEQKDPAEFLRKKAGFDQGDREAFGHEYANATAARDFYLAASENPKAILDYIQVRCLAGHEPTEQEIDRFVVEKTKAEAAYALVGYAVLGMVAGARGIVATAGETTASETRINGFSTTESSVIREARAILQSSELDVIREARASGRSASVTIGGRLIQYEPALPASGMTMFEENGFLIGSEAFGSSAELGKTILHELYRLSTSVSSRGVSSDLAAREAGAAAGFAERAFGELRE